MTSSLVTDYDHGISAIDAQFHRPKRAAIHLIVENDTVALVDTGTAFSIPGVVQTLQQRNLAPESVAYVFLTHIHLDHAGGAGECMRYFPKAKLVVHPRGARHIAEPSRLVAGAIAVYGEAEFKRVYGEIHPIAKERIIEAPDECTIDLNGRSLLLLDTPGHARHHYCIYDKKSQSFFTGDTFGVSYRDFDVAGMEFVFPTTTPVQFDPVAAHASLDRLMSYQPRFAFLTHYGRIGHLPQHAAQMHQLVDAYVDMARKANKNAANRQNQLVNAMQELFLQKLSVHGCKLPQETILKILKSDIKLNVQGLEFWLDQSPNKSGQH